MIMTEFYHAQRLSKKGVPLPSILGLTASPAQNGKAKRLRFVERSFAYRGS